MITHVRTGINQSDICLSHFLSHDACLETVNFLDRFLECIDHELLGDTVRTHDHDELTIQEGDLILGELPSAETQNKLTRTTFRSTRLDSNLIKDFRSRTSFGFAISGQTDSTPLAPLHDQQVTCEAQAVDIP